MKIENIQKSFQGKQILKNITLETSKGSCVGILGSNGSGKSTLLSVLAGVLKADGGSFESEGKDLLKDHKLRTQMVGFVPQGNPLYEELTAKDNLLLWYSKEALDKELKQGVLAMLGIPEFIKVPVSKMSGGMKKRLAIGCCVAHDPQILLLDEPTAALDLVCKERIYNYITDFKKQGKIVLLTTHDERELELCDSLYLLKNGSIRPYEYDGNIHHLVGDLGKKDDI